MTDQRDTLKSMLNNFINDNHEQASMDFHNFLTTKFQKVAGLAPATSEENHEIVTNASDDDLED